MPSQAPERERRDRRELPRTTEALTVLLIYFVVGAVILGVLDWFPSEAAVPAAAAEAAAVAVPIGATP